MNIRLQSWMKIETFDKEATQRYFDLLYKEGAYKKKIDTTKLYYENWISGCNSIAQEA